MGGIARGWWGYIGMSEPERKRTFAQKLHLPMMTLILGILTFLASTFVDFKIGVNEKLSEMKKTSEVVARNLVIHNDESKQRANFSFIIHHQTKLAPCNQCHSQKDTP